MEPPTDASPPAPTPSASPDSSNPAPPAPPTDRMTSVRSISDPPRHPTMSSSSNPIGVLNNARRPPVRSSIPASSVASGGLPQDMQAKMRAFHLSRQGTPPGGRPSASQPMPFSQPADANAGLAGGLRLPMGGNRPQLPQGLASAPAVVRGGKPSLSERRNMPKLGGLPGSPAAPSASPSLSLKGGANPAANGDMGGSMFNKFSNYVDTEKGTLRFAGKAVIHGQGIDFSSGNNFSISLDEVDTLEELGKGNYGTVYKVRHARPRQQRLGLGLQVRSTAPNATAGESGDSDEALAKNTTGVIMAMKEIRLELDEAKFAAIIMELDILHRCVSPYIIDFYGAFFQEGAVYICIEFMDGGSIDKLYGAGVPENVLRKITFATTMGLKELKDVHNIIHRDVKPTNILVNTRGQVKICDFGVSGNLVASFAKTNIGCQSYMAPERISGGGVSQGGGGPSSGTYSVQSDVWSLGLTIIECAMGRYPYPPETYNNIFSQLSAIVDGDPPDLPAEGYSPITRDFVRGCLHKIPKLRPTYSMLLQHPWLAALSKPAAISEDDETSSADSSADGPDGPAAAAANGSSANADASDPAYDDEVAQWVRSALERKAAGQIGASAKPALHAAPLDSVSPPAV
ncbi:STE/STE7 protein kinase [Pseudogymnoascus sp. 23342-1-I1]|nr:STE/STE7 protein kinase [Pseudogymnoascus sp. 23342-1-I1]